MGYEVSSDNSVERRHTLSQESFAKIQAELVHHENQQRLQFRFIEQTRCKGVYAIWWKHRCLYVGKAVNDTIYKRLASHLSGSHNRNLSLWIGAKNGDLKFSYAELNYFVDKVKIISMVETQLIKVLEAELNIQHGQI